MGDVFSAVRESAIRLLRGERCDVFLVNEQGALESEGTPFPSGQFSETLIGRAGALGRPAVFSEEPGTVNHVANLSGVRSAISFPISAHGKLQAVVYVTHSQVRGLYGAEEIRLARIISELAGGAIENSDGFSEVEALTRFLEERVEERTAQLKTSREDIERTLSLLEATLDSTADGILVVDHAGKILSFNSQFVSLWGIPPDVLALREDEAALSFVLDQLIDPDAFLQKVGELYSTPMSESFDVLEFKDGRIVERYSKAHVLGGQSVGRVWSFRDVTTRRRAEKQRETISGVIQAANETSNLEELLARVHESLIQVLSAENCIVALYDDQTDTVSFPFYVDQVDPDPPPDQLLGRGCLAYVCRQGDPIRVNGETFRELMARGEVELVGTQSAAWLGVPLKIGSRVIGALTVQHYSDPDAYDDDDLQVLMSIGSQIATAIERRRSELALQQSQDTLASVIENLPYGVFLLDGTRRFRLANAAARDSLRLLGRYDENGDVLIGLGDIPIGALAETLAGQGTRDVMVSEPEQRLFEVTTTPLADEAEGPWAVWILRDVTDERAREDKLQRQERLAAVGQLAAGIAHDFNNMLHGMMMYAELMTRHPLMPASLRSRAEAITEQGKRGTKLIRQILDFSRKSIVSRQQLDLCAFVENLAKMLERTIPENIAIRVHCKAGDLRVLADATQVEQLVMNLVLNARDAMPDGGVLGVGLSRLHVSSSEHAPVPDMPVGSWVCLEVSDTGIGIPMEVRSHLFEPFYTTKGPGKGTGLGLAQVYGIVERHEAFVHFESELGRGTTFSVFFRELTEPPVSVDLPSAAIAPPGKGQTILVAEDEVSVRQVISEALTGLGYTVLTAQNGIEALSVFVENSSRISLVLSDMVMPEMGGIDLCRELKKKTPGIPVILMSGYPLGQESSEVLRDGTVEWFQKPFTIDALAAAVDQALAAA